MPQVKSTAFIRNCNRQAHTNDYYSIMVIMDNSTVSTVENAKDKIIPIQGKGVGVKESILCFT